MTQASGTVYLLEVPSSADDNLTSAFAGMMHSSSLAGVRMLLNCKCSFARAVPAMQAMGRRVKAPSRGPDRACWQLLSVAPLHGLLDPVGVLLQPALGVLYTCVEQLHRVRVQLAV